jgi:hypothetical protein
MELVVAVVLGLAFLVGIICAGVAFIKAMLHKPDSDDYNYPPKDAPGWGEPGYRRDLRH